MDGWRMLGGRERGKEKRKKRGRERLSTIIIMYTLSQGEAQKIDKIMEIFALEYYKNNKEQGAIKSEDSAYILSFAIMMLHTALHNPSVKHKTTKREWVSMNRGMSRYLGTIC